jgi:hypothetical protein
MNRPLSVLVVCGILVSQAHAEYSVKNYQEMYKNEDSKSVSHFGFGMYLQGLWNGILYMHTLAEGVHQQPLFCIPAKLTLNEQNIADLIDAQLKREATVEHHYADKLDETPVGAILIGAILETFPCQK